MRHDAPIFLPFSSPDSSTAMHIGFAHAERARRVGGAEQLRRHRRRRRAAGEALLHHLLREAEADRELRGRAGRPRAAAALLHALRHLVLHVVIEVADRRHAAALVDRGFDFGRHRHVLDDEAGDLEAVLRGHRRD